VEVFLVSMGIVAIAEIGDKTQLLAFLLSARFRKPLPIVLGIFLATTLNHGAAGALGTWITSLVGPETLSWALGVLFIAMALWVLVPDDLDEAGAAPTRFGAFGATLVSFFLAEIGDKTEIATIALAAQYQARVLVVLGTTLGMMLANVPAVVLGERITQKVPIRLIRGIAAAVFAGFGAAALLGTGASQFGF
jgi:putative Ca2+/H+ antiporter (TMEM165/GDT1 family)